MQKYKIMVKKLNMSNESPVNINLKEHDAAGSWIFQFRIKPEVSCRAALHPQQLASCFL
jgi:hypothetical protein